MRRARWIAQLQHRVGRGEEERIAVASGKELDLRIGLAAILLEAQRQHSVRIMQRRLPCDLRPLGGGLTDRANPSCESDDYGQNEKWQPSTPNALTALIVHRTL
jgi:hypothetical protein